MTIYSGIYIYGIYINEGKGKAKRTVRRGTKKKGKRKVLQKKKRRRIEERGVNLYLGVLMYALLWVSLSLGQLNAAVAVACC